jgi:hypothetical protein
MTPLESAETKKSSADWTEEELAALAARYGVKHGPLDYEISPRQPGEE